MEPTFYNNMKLNLSATILKFSKIIVKFLFSVIKVLSRLFLLPLIILSPVIIDHLQYDLDNNTSIIIAIVFIILSFISMLLFVIESVVLIEGEEYLLFRFYKLMVKNAVYIDNEESPIKKIQESKNQYINGQWMDDKINKDNSIPPIGSWNSN